MLYIRCKTTCSKPWSFLRGGRRKRTTSKPHQGRMEMPLMRPRRRPLKHVNVKKKRGFLTSKTMSRDRRTGDDLQRHHQRHSCKTEALEKHVKTVNMRTESLATTEADFFEALLDRQEEAQKHLNELAAQLSKQNTTTRSTQCKPHSAERRNKHTLGAQSLLFFFLHHVRVKKSGGLMFARRQKERIDLALLVSSDLKSLSRAAHLMQQWPDGTKHSRRV